MKGHEPREGNKPYEGPTGPYGRLPGQSEHDRVQGWGAHTERALSRGSPPTWQSTDQHMSVRNHVRPGRDTHERQSKHQHSDAHTVGSSAWLPQPHRTPTRAWDMIRAPERVSH